MNTRRERNEGTAILALLAHGSISAAARNCPISEATIWRWSQNQEFKAKYREARQRAFEMGLDALVSASLEAVTTLRRNLTCGQPSAEIAAAKAILEHGIRTSDFNEVQDRLTALEALPK